MNSYYAAAGAARASTCSTTPKSSASSSADGRFEAARVRVGGGTRDRARPGRGAGRRRIRVEPRVAARSLGRAPPTTSSSAARRTTQGTLLRLMLDAGAQPVGDPRACHAIAVDARAPKFDGGIVTRLDCVPLGIVVNKHGERFYDEGEDFWPKRYAIWGRPRRAAAGSDCVFDHRREGGRPVHAVGVSADRRAVDPRARRAARTAADRLDATVAAFNAAVRPGTFDHAVLDDCRTEG